MIRKGLYIKCVNAMEKLSKFSDKIYKDTDGAVSLFEINPLQNLLTAFEELLEYCTKDNYYDECGSNLSYFMYEQDWGKNGDEYFVTESDGTEYKIHNSKELWKYLVRCNPDIEDKGGQIK